MYEVRYILKDHQTRLERECGLGPFATRLSAEEALKRLAGADRTGSTLLGAEIREVEVDGNIGNVATRREKQEG